MKAKIIKKIFMSDPLFRVGALLVFVKRGKKYRIQVVHYDDDLVVETKYVEFDNRISANRFWSDLRDIYERIIPKKIPF